MKGLLCGVAVVALGLCGEASAAEGSPGERAEVNALDELVVTARRREEAIQDVPAAVSAVTAERMLDQGGIKDVKDLSYLLPGTSFADTQTINAENNIRGAGAGTTRTNGADAPIAVLRDGASIAGGNLGGRVYTRADLFDLQRVEVIRGPQGALYGVNAVGGVMQAVSQRPKPSFGYRAGVTYSPDIERTAVEAIVNLPIGERLAIRLGGQKAVKEDGFFRNLHTGGHGDVEDYGGARVSALWTPTDALSLFTVLDYSDELSAGNYIRHTTQLNDKTTLPANIRPFDQDGPFLYGHNTSDDVDRIVKNWLTELKWDGAWGTLTATTLLRSREASFRNDEDNTAPGYGLPAYPATCGTRSCSTLFYDMTEMASQDLKFEGELGPAFDYQIGGNLSRKTSDFYTLTDGRTVSLVNLNPNPLVNSGAVTREEETSWGAFASVSWRPTDRFTVDAALRYGRSDKAFSSYVVRLQPSAGLTCDHRRPLDVYSLNPACAQTKVALSEMFDSTTPSLAVRYEIAPWMRVFASVARGDRAGGFNGNSVLDPGIPAAFQPEKSLAYEAGAKFELGGAYFTLSAFYNDYSELLVGLINYGADNVARNYRFNAGEAQTHGFDFEVFGTRDLSGELGRLTYSAAVNYLMGEVESGQYAGLQIENSPEWMYTATLNWRRPLVADWDLFASLSYRGQRGGYTGFIAFNNQVSAGNLDLFNGSLGVRNDAWRFEISARNLLDERYEAIRDATRSTWGDPREIRIGLAYAFGSERR